MTDLGQVDADLCLRPVSSRHFRMVASASRSASLKCVTARLPALAGASFAPRLFWSSSTWEMIVPAFSDPPSTIAV
jgi:hypothetical protein